MKSLRQKSKLGPNKEADIKGAYTQVDYDGSSNKDILQKYHSNQVAPVQQQLRHADTDQFVNYDSTVRLQSDYQHLKETQRTDKGDTIHHDEVYLFHYNN